MPLAELPLAVLLGPICATGAAFCPSAENVQRDEIAPRKRILRRVVKLKRDFIFDYE